MDLVHTSRGVVGGAAAADELDAVASATYESLASDHAAPQVALTKAMGGARSCPPWLAEEQVAQLCNMSEWIHEALRAYIDQRRRRLESRGVERRTTKIHNSHHRRITSNDGCRPRVTIRRS
jgi:hypothetical protein